MRKLILAFCLVFLSIFVWVDFAFAIFSCTLSESNNCDTGEVCVFEMSDATNAHAKKTCTVSGNYGRKVCCSDDAVSLGNDCAAANKAVVLRLSDATNAHVEKNNYSPQNYTEEVCLSVDSGSVLCQYEQNSCSVDYTCLVSISGATNAHVAKCSGSGSYKTKVCCKTTLAPDFTILASPTSIRTGQIDSEKSTITLTAFNGFNSLVDLSASILPIESKIIWAFGTNPVTPDADGETSDLTITFTDAPVGVYTLTVTGVGGGKTHSVDIALTVVDLSVTLAADPNSGTSFLNGVELTADVGGAAAGTINYTFWCDCAAECSSVADCRTKCGNWNHKKDGIFTDPYTAPDDVCNSTYSGTGIYTAKVVAERDEANAAVGIATVTVAVSVDECVSGNCCDMTSHPYKIMPDGSQPTGHIDDTNGFCTGTEGVETTSYVYIRDWYCNGIDTDAHYDDVLQDTCDICKYCQDNHLSCFNYDGADCDPADYYDDWKNYCSVDFPYQVWKKHLFHDFYCETGSCTDHTEWRDHQLDEDCDDYDGCAGPENLDWHDYSCSSGFCDYTVLYDDPRCISGEFICTLSVLEKGIAGQWIDINVGGSKGDITEVRFSSDNNINGNSDGTWDPSLPNYYNWNVSEGNWNAYTKIMKWSFAEADNYEVWAEVKDDSGEFKQCYDTITIEQSGECQRDYPDVVFSPSSQEGNPGDTLSYEILVINNDLNCDSSTFNLSTGEYCLETDWTCSLDSVNLTISAGQSVSTILWVTSSAAASGIDYPISVTAANSETGLEIYSRTGYGAYKVFNQPPNKPGILGEGVIWDNCSGASYGASIPTFNWIYSDDDGHLQIAYEIEIQIGDDEFIVFEEGESTSYAPVTPLTADWQDAIKENWDTDCKWKVRVQDEPGDWSEWSDLTEFTTPKHPGPYPDFNPDSQRRSIDEIAEFFDTSVCYTSENPGEGRICQGIASYEWDFDCATGEEFTDSYVVGDVFKSYSNIGKYKVKLRITDDVDTCVSDAKEVIVTIPLPEWIEIPPF